MDVCIHVGAIRLKVTPRLPRSDFRKVRDQFTYTMHNYHFTTQHKLYGWNGQKTLFFKNQTAPTGCLYRMKRILTDHCGHDVEVAYEHDYEPRGDCDIFGLKLKPFQIKAVERMIKYRRGIIDAPVRAGKTAIAAAAIKRIGHYTTWLVTYGKDLVYQTRKDLEYHLDTPIGVFSESNFEHAQIIVTSYQAITRVISAMQSKQRFKPATQQRNERIFKLIKDSKVFIFDECHHVLAPKNRKLLNEMHSAGYVLGLSGTPKPDNTHALELEAAIGGIIFKVNYETLIKHKRLARPMIMMYEAPYKWYTTGFTKFDDVYENNIVENLYRNMFIAEVVNNLYKANKTTFIMIRKLAHGPILRALIPGSVFVRGSISSDRRAELYKQLQDKNIHCIIATVGKEGLNIPRLDAVVNAEGYKSSVTTLQKMRSLTAAEGKKFGMIIDFIDRGKYLHKHSKKRIQLYKKLGSVKFKTKKIPADHYPMEGSRWAH